MEVDSVAIEFANRSALARQRTRGVQLWLLRLVLKEQLGYKFAKFAGYWADATIGSSR